MKSIKHINPFIILSTVTLLLITPMCFGAAYYVDATNGNDSNHRTSHSAPWKTISKVNNSDFQPGDFILFKRGETWRERLKVPSSGSISNPITFGAYGTGDKPIIDGTGLLKTIYLNGKSFININNLEIIKGGHGIFITSDATNGQINITYCDIHNSENNNVSIKNRGNVTIENCTVYNSGGNGISAYTLGAANWGDRAGHNVKVLRNTIYNNSKNGLFIHGDDAVVRNNEMYGNGSVDREGYYHNIYISGDNAIIEKNILRDAAYGDGIRFLGSNLTVRYNFIRHNRKHGIGIWNDYPVTHSNLNISYNLFIQRSYTETPVSLPLTINIDNAATAGSFSNIKIYNNSVYGENDNANGFSFKKCSDVDVKNNIIDLKNAFLMGIYSTASVSSDYNMFKSNKSKPFYSESGSGPVAFSQWRDDDGYGRHSIEGDPGFTDPSNNNLIIQSASPAVGAGANLGQAYNDGFHPNSNLPNGVLTLDQDNHGAWEIGAYVYQSGEPPAAPMNIRIK